MIDYSNFFTYLESIGHAPLTEMFSELLDGQWESLRHGDFEKWNNAIKSLPDIEVQSISLDSGAVSVDTNPQLTQETIAELHEQLMILHPWRKGPFDLFGLHVDTEWRSDLKWARLKDKIAPLKDRVILDVGSGNGYYCLRMAGEGAKAAIGIDPFLLYVMQFQAMNKYYRCERANVLPLGIDDVPEDMSCFDTVFSMGVLYHRRDPLEHLRKLYALLTDKGQLVLETIILDSDSKEALYPEGRYAKMRNVFALPSPILAVDWLKDAGFADVEVIDIAKTTTDEQRKTDWMTFESLSDFLDPANPELTIEGHPAPVRAVIVANKA